MRLGDTKYLSVLEDIPYFYNTPVAIRDTDLCTWSADNALEELLFSNVHCLLQNVKIIN